MVEQAEQDALMDRLEIDDMIAVSQDVVHKVKPEDSKLKYTKDLLEFRKIVAEQIAAMPDGAVPDFPYV